ncbi:hypothetical protein F5Y10DRAFT_40374 [Nemania abortiva]|nr:hypothetical protein F5Y10DRAFT_40374 [Nemania abortiva]
MGTDIRYHVCPNSESNMSESNASKSNASETDAPESNGSKTDTSELNASETNASKTNAFESNVSESNASKSDAFKTNASELNASETDASKTDAFESNASESNASKCNASETNAPESNGSKTNTSELNASETDASKTDAFESDASESNVSESDVSESDASESNMFNTDAFESNVSESKYNTLECEYDLANTHERNVDLQQNSTVILYLNILKNIELLKDMETCDQLSILLHNYRRNTILLFESKQQPGNNDEDYQLCPCYSYLRQRGLVQTPYPSLLRLFGSKDIKQQIPKYIIFLGWLFVNAKNGNEFNTCCYSKRQRLTRWTGYELFIGDDLEIWSVFNPASHRNDVGFWYPVFFRLERNPRPGIACFLLSVKKLGGVTFEEIAAYMENTRVQGAFQIHEVEMQEANEWLNGKPEETSRHELIQ